MAVCLTGEKKIVVKYGEHHNKSLRTYYLFAYLGATYISGPHVSPRIVPLCDAARSIGGVECQIRCTLSVLYFGLRNGYL